jgi:hypothetical protein
LADDLPRELRFSPLDAEPPDAGRDWREPPPPQQPATATPGDDPLRQLLSSPLDAERPGVHRGAPAARKAGRTGSPGGPWLAGSILVGAAAVLIGYFVAGAGSASTPTTTELTTTTTTIATQPEAVLPTGYTPVGERLGMKVERILVRSDAVFVSLSTVVPNTLAPAESSGYQGGAWSLVLTDGRRVDSVGESTDVLAPGFVSVQFPADAYGAADIASLELVAVAQRASQDVDARTTEPFTIPTDGSTVTVPLTPTTFTLDAGVDLVFTDLQVSASGGSMSWSLTGTAGEAGALVYPYLEFDDEAGAPEIPTVLTDNPTFGYFFAQWISTLPPRPEGEILYDPPGVGPNLTFTTDVALTAVFHATVGWAVYSPAAVDIPIGDDVVVTELG